MKKVELKNNVSILNLNEIAKLAMKEFDGMISLDLLSVLHEIHKLYPETVPVSDCNLIVSEKNLSYHRNHLCKEAEIVLILKVKLGDNSAFETLLEAKRNYLKNLAAYIHYTYEYDGEILDNSIENWYAEICLVFWRHVLQLPVGTPVLLKSTTGFDFKQRNSPLYVMRNRVLQENSQCKMSNRYTRMLAAIKRWKEEAEIKQLSPEETETMAAKFFRLPSGQTERMQFVQALCDRVNGVNCGYVSFDQNELTGYIPEEARTEKGYRKAELELNKYNDRTLRYIASLFTAESRVADIVIPLAARNKHVLVYLDCLFNSQKPSHAKRVDIQYAMDKYNLPYEVAKYYNKDAIRILRRELVEFRRFYKAGQAEK